jgi:Ca2+-binding EF-hand superfamily protein
LTILCGGSRQDKVRAAFSAFDQNGDGFISFAEMTAYLRSVFSLMFAVKPGEPPRPLVQRIFSSCVL